MNDTGEQQAPTVSTFVAVCSKHLENAIADSRVEMDGLAMEVVESGIEKSGELFARLQSVDRLMQRLDNVKSNLNHLATYLDADDEQGSLADLTEAMRSSFTMPSERELFEAMVGCPSNVSTQSDDEVVLF